MKILFVCTGNTCRSPMAQGIFNDKFSGNGYCCKSAGLSALNGVPPTENAVEALKEINIDISSYRSTNIGNVDLNDFDVFAVMTNDHVQVLKLLGVPSEKIKLLGNGVPDPYGGSLDEYRACRDAIIEGINNLIRDEEM